MKASIVILSFNRCVYLKNTVRSLIESLNRREEVEIILVDNGSSDESPSYIRDLLEQGIIDKALLFATNQGISKGYNSGFALANSNASYLIKLDCDVIIHHSGWLEEMDTLFNADPSIGLLMLFQENHPTMKDCVRTNHLGRTFISLTEIIVGSACFTIPKNVIESLGYFYEDHDYLLFYDDIDYFIRLELLGKKAFYLLSHTSSYQEDLDTSVYLKYDQMKDPMYERMNIFHKDLNGLYQSGTFPMQRFYPRLRDLALMGQNKSLIELP